MLIIHNLAMPAVCNRLYCLLTVLLTILASYLFFILIDVFFDLQALSFLTLVLHMILFYVMICSVLRRIGNPIQPHFATSHQPAQAYPPTSQYVQPSQPAYPPTNPSQYASPSAPYYPPVSVPPSAPVEPPANTPSYASDQPPPYESTV